MKIDQDLKNVINIKGNLTGTQIQQGNVNSVQTMSTDSKMDYDDLLNKMMKIQKAIRSNPDFKEDFGEKAKEVMETVNDVVTMINKKENPSKINILINRLKELAIGISGSMIASGIVGLLS